MKEKAIGSRYKIIGTKVSPLAYAQIKAVADKAGVSVYILFQTIVDSILKALCTDSVRDDYLNEVLFNFADLSKMKEGFSLIGFNLWDLHISKVLGIIHKSKKERGEIVLYEKTDGGELVINRGNDPILKTFLESFSPAMLNCLKRIQEVENKGTLTSALKYALSEALPPSESLTDEILSIFDDDDRVSGRKAGDMQKYRRTMTKTIQ